MDQYLEYTNAMFTLGIIPNMTYSQAYTVRYRVSPGLCVVLDPLLETYLPLHVY